MRTPALHVRRRAGKEMHLMFRVIAVAAVATAAAAFAAGAVAPAPPAAGAVTETSYYGKTSQGLGVSIPVRGNAITATPAPTSSGR